MKNCTPYFTNFRGFFCISRLKPLSVGKVIIFCIGLRVMHVQSRLFSQEIALATI